MPYDYDVFISYEWGLKKEVEELQKLLESLFNSSSIQIKIWRDPNLKNNDQSIYLQLGKQIKSSKLFMCFLTKAYVKSVMCCKEINFASKLGKKIIYLMIERMTLDELGDEIAFIMGNTVYMQCYKNPNWWTQNANEIKNAIEINLEDMQSQVNSALINKRYRRCEKLGQGADAYVYKVEDILEKSDSKFKFKAIKQFKSVDFTMNIDLKKQIEKEVTILKEVDNENIIKFFEFFAVFVPEVGHIFYLVTEFYQESSLDKRIAEQELSRKRFDNQLIIKWILQLLNALEYLHDFKNIVHRDIKPGNIFLTEFERLVLGDMGHSKFLNNTNSSLNQEFSKNIFGTYRYLAPEALMNETSGNTWSVDIWAFGCVVFEMNELNPFFDGKNSIQISKQIEKFNNKFEKKLDNMDSTVVSIIKKSIVLEKEKRLTAKQLKELISNPKKEEDLPTSDSFSASENTDSLDSLVLDPPNELIFKGPFNRSGSAVSFTIKNPTNKLIAFKIKTTKPKLYYVKPNSGIIKFNETIKLEAYLEPFQYDAKEIYNHKFMVEFFHLNESEAQLSREDVVNRWNDFPRSRIIGLRLRCILQFTETETGGLNGVQNGCKVN